MEVIDARMFTSAWGRYYNDAKKGVWMAAIAGWTARDGLGFVQGDDKLYIGDTPWSPGPLVGIIRDKMRDAGLALRIGYKTAKLVGWRNRVYGGRKYDYPVYEHDEQKFINITIEPFTSINTIFRIAEDEQLVYDVTCMTKLPYHVFEDNFSGDLSAWDVVEDASITTDQECEIEEDGYIEIEDGSLEYTVMPNRLDFDVRMPSGSEFVMRNAYVSGPLIYLVSNEIRVWDVGSAAWDVAGAYVDDITCTISVLFGDGIFTVLKDGQQIGGKYVLISPDAPVDGYKFTCVTGTCYIDNVDILYGKEYEAYEDVRYNETITIFCLASPTTRYLYGAKFWELYENGVKIQDAVWASPYFCATCTGTGVYPPVNSIIDTHLGQTCPECDGFGFSGPHATGFMLDRKGADVGMTRNDGESDEQFGKRIWARKWKIIPTLDEIKRFFDHFAHAQDDECVRIRVIEDMDEPTFFMALNLEKMGSKALWQPGDPNENWDGLVDMVTPAGVNGYFGGWIMVMRDTIEASELVDASSQQYWGYLRDVYNPVFEGAVFRESLFGGFTESSRLESTIFFDDFSSGDFSKFQIYAGSPYVAGGKAILTSPSTIGKSIVCGLSILEVEFLMKKPHGGISSSNCQLYASGFDCMIIFDESTGLIYADGVSIGPYPDDVEALILIQLDIGKSAVRVFVDDVELAGWIATDRLVTPYVLVLFSTSYSANAMSIDDVCFKIVAT